MTAAAWHAIKDASKATARRTLLRAGRFVLARPRLRLRILALLHAHPTVAAQIRRALGQGWANSVGNTGAIRHQAPDFPGAECLSPHARVIYRQLLQQRNFMRGDRDGKS